MAGGGGGGDGEPEFQIAPMIDVLLVLLVFFVMITSAEVLKVDKELKLPVSPHAKPIEKEQIKNSVPLNVRWDKAANKAVLVMNDRVDMPPEAVIEEIKKSKATNPLTRIVIRGDTNVPAGEIQKVMNLVAEGGVADIAFSASNK